MRRRTFLKTAGAGALGLTAVGHYPARAADPAGRTYDAAVVGAGAFGVWTAWHLRRAGQRVVIVEGYGPGNARASRAERPG